MKTPPEQAKHVDRVRPRKRSRHVYENPLDKHQRSTLGLSSEVGKACSAWLDNRGIKTVPWGQYFSLGPRIQKTRSGSQLPDDL
jgi:hypothetical protein